jgi:hypothetical protein
VDKFFYKWAIWATLHGEKRKRKDERMKEEIYIRKLLLGMKKKEETVKASETSPNNERTAKRQKAELRKIERLNEM